MGVKMPKELEKLHEAMADRKTLLQRLHKAAAAEALTQAQLGFRKSEDPDGKPWAPLQLRNGMPLRDTGVLANSFSSRPTDRGFVIGAGAWYAVVHQNGMTIRPKRAKLLRFRDRSGGQRPGKGGFVFAKKVTIPPRKMVPWPRLSRRWSEAIQKAVDASFNRFFRGK